MTTAKNQYQTEAGRLYVRRTFIFMAGYIALNLAAIAGLADALAGPWRWLFAVAVAARVIGQIWAMLTLIRTSDEFVGAVLARQFILAAGLTMAVASVWGFGEYYAGAPHISAAMVYPLFWATFGATAHFIKSYRI